MSEGTRPPYAAIGAGGVLIADDDARVREALVELLGAKGLTIVGEAADGEEAVALAEELEPDVILMDLRMPGLDGLAATRTVKERLPLTQIIVLTAYDDPRVRDHASAEGVYCYLVKGCPPTLIVEMVLRAFAHRRELVHRYRRSVVGDGPPRPAQAEASTDRGDRRRRRQRR